MSNIRRSALSPLCFSGALLWAAILVLFAGVVVPLIHANRFRQRIRTALERSLGRPVEIGDVTLHLLTGPGFQLQNVIIGEDPAFGIEHFAYMTSMQVRLRLRTLWTGQVQLASLTLIEPSINLAKNPQGRWNFEALLERAGAGKPKSGAAGSRTYFPYIGIRDGRVNFKFGDYKSVFHMQEVEAALSPARDAEGRWQIRVAGRPARTDHLLRGMGRFTGEGEISTARRQVRLDLVLETSPMEHLLTLLYGHDFGVHGELGARVHLSGQATGIDVRGTLRAGDLHRWDLPPTVESGVTVPFAGRLNLPEQKLELEANPSGAVRARLAVQNYLSAPHWRATVELDQAPAAPVFRTARHLGAALPSGLELGGRLDGRLEFPGSHWPQGTLKLTGGRLVAGKTAPVTVSEVEVELDGPAFAISPAEAEIGTERVEVSAAGRLDPFAVEAVVAGRGVRLESVREPIAVLRPGWPASLVSGSWDGRVFYRKKAGQPGAWSGAGMLSRARWQPEGLESPVEVTQARVRWEPPLLQLEALSGSLNETHFTGSCQRREKEQACKLRIAELNWAQLDGWLNPQQKRSRWDLWRRALGRADPEGSSWLKRARIGGTVNVGNLRLGNWAFRNVQSELAWDGETLSLNGLRAELEKASLAGTLRAEFSEASPRYRLQGAITGLDLKGLSGRAGVPANFQRGTMDLKLVLAASGRTAEDLRAGLRATGSFQGRSILLGNVEWEDADEAEGEVEIRSLDGRFEWTPKGLELTALRMMVGRETYQGRGSIGGDPPVQLDVAARGKQSRLVAAAEEASAAVP